MKYTLFLKTFKSACSIENIHQSDHLIDDGCTFNRDGNFAVFETPTPYLANTDCIRNFTCSDPNHTGKS